MLCFFLLTLVLSSSPQIATAGDSATNCGCEDKPQINVLAVVNGIKITKQDLSIDGRTQISLLQDTVTDARRRAVEFQINKLLLEAETSKRGVSVEALLKLEVAEKIVQPTEAEARAFYDRNRERIAESFKEVKSELLARLRRERESVRAEEYTNALRAAATITVLEEPVTPPADESQLSRVFATVNGRKITSRDVEDGLRPLILQVQQQVYAYRKRDVELKINDLLLEQEAKRQGMTPKALLDQNVRAKLPLVTDARAQAFYNENKTRLRGNFSEIKFQIMQYLLEQEERKLIAAYAEQLRAGAAVQMYLTEPPKE